jgi:predicted HicB family RNase H-like nuclease
MAYSEAQKRATMKWDKENYDRVYLTVPKGMKQQIEAVAQEQGMSIRSYILEAINEKMGRK